MRVAPSRPTPLQPQPPAPASAARPNAVAARNVAVARDVFTGAPAQTGPIPGVPAEAWSNPGAYMHDLLTGAAPPPPGFAEWRHFTPVRVETPHGPRMQKPNGDVSVPFGLGPEEAFLPAAKTHDYGYDLLRFFARQGAPLGPEARKAADALFREDCFHEANDNHSGLERWKYRAWAQVYALGVELNSRKQAYGAP